MKLLRELLELQHEHGFLSDTLLRDLSREQKIPLYRLEELVSFYPAFRRSKPQQFTIDICRDACCAIAEDRDARQALIDELNRHNVDYEVREVSCLGRCDAAPAVAINDQPTAPITLSHHGELYEQIQNNRTEPTDQPNATWTCNIYENCADYYSTVKRLARDVANLSKTSVDRLKATNLTGRGGAGFPTGLKWELVSKEPAATKYVVCNADESEPGTFKDREILRHAPHLVIEGMLLAGLTIGSEQGIVYIRHEYGPEEKVLQLAIEDAYEQGILGANAAGSGQRFELEIFVSPGGYILGEETALLEALEDKRGEPRNKPPYPGSVGLWGQPTLINNVETFAVAPSIINRGPQWWSEQGIGEYEGLKFVCISGDVNAPGVFEVPMGTTFQEVVEMAGGIIDGKRLKAFLPGGASSLFLKPEYLATPIDFPAVKKVGSMLGTGAIMIFHEDRDLYDIATNITRFFRNESCGKCVPCRVGSEKGVTLLEGVSTGKFEAGQLEILDDLHGTLMETSICGLGQVALAPMLSMLKQFPEEIPNYGD